MTFEGFRPAVDPEITGFTFQERKTPFGTVLYYAALAEAQPEVEKIVTITPNEEIL